MKVLVCGGRSYMNRRRVFEVLDSLHPKIIICGGASGADDIAVGWAKVNGKKAEIFFPDWTAFGPGAGPRRNQKMLKDGKPDVVVAFPGGKRTAAVIQA